MPDADYEFRSFAPVLGAAAPDEPTAAWFEAVRFGFHAPRPEAGELRRRVESAITDGRVLSGAYLPGAPAPHAWGPHVPVATYASYASTLNVGAGRLLPVHLISEVTVRPTHRRRGLLRRLITADLQRARGAGVAIAALTASEGGIYGRFGFGAATFLKSIEVDTTERFRLTAAGAPCGPGTSAGAGMVELADPEQLLTVGRDVFDRFHAATVGSVGRDHSYEARISGLWGHGPDPDRSVRTALHYGGDGGIDGYVSYKFCGWERTPPTIEVIDLVAASSAAYLQLWEFLGSIDLVQRVIFSQAPVADPLPWALADPRAYSVTAESDRLWLRILDPAAALGARAYGADGELTLALTDSLGLAGGGYRLTVSGGRADVVSVTADAAEVTMDVAALGSLYLGGADVATLARAGRLRAADAGALATLGRLFGSGPLPYCCTFF